MIYHFGPPLKYPGSGPPGLPIESVSIARSENLSKDGFSTGCCFVDQPASTTQKYRNTGPSGRFYLTPCILLLKGWWVGLDKSNILYLTPGIPLSLIAAKEREKVLKGRLRLPMTLLFDTSPPEYCISFPTHHSFVLNLLNRIRLFYLSNNRGV